MRYHADLKALHLACQREAQVNREELSRLVGQPVLYGHVRAQPCTVLCACCGADAAHHCDRSSLVRELTDLGNTCS